MFVSFCRFFRNTSSFLRKPAAESASEYRTDRAAFEHRPCGFRAKTARLSSKNRAAFESEFIDGKLARNGNVATERRKSRRSSRRDARDPDGGFRDAAACHRRGSFPPRVLLQRKSLPPPPRARSALRTSTGWRWREGG